MKPTTHVEYRRPRKIQKNCENAIPPKTTRNPMTIKVLSAAASSVGTIRASKTRKAKNAYIAP